MTVTLKGMVSQFDACASYDVIAVSSIVYETIRSEYTTLAENFPLKISRSVAKTLCSEWMH